MNREKKDENNSDYKKKNSEIEFYTPKSNLSIDSLNRNKAYNILHKYVNRSIRNGNINKKKNSSKSKVPIKRKKKYVNRNESHSKLSILSYIKENNKKQDFLLKDGLTYKTNKEDVCAKTKGIRTNSNEEGDKTNGIKNNRILRKRVFSESTTSILSYFRNVNVKSSGEGTMNKSHYAGKNVYDRAGKAVHCDVNGLTRNDATCNGAIRNGAGNCDVSTCSEAGAGGGYFKRVRSETYDRKMLNEEKEQLEFLTAKKIEEMHSSNYFEILYVYCKKYFLYDKMEFISRMLFFRKRNIKNFVMLIETLFLKKQYIELLNLLRIHRNLWVFPYAGRRGKKKRSKSSAVDGAICYNKFRVHHGKGGVQHTASNTAKRVLGRNLSKVKETSKGGSNDEMHTLKKENPLKEAIEKGKCPFLYSNVASVRWVRNGKKTASKVVTGAIGKKGKKGEKAENSTRGTRGRPKEIQCVNYVAFIKIMSLIKMKNKNCLNKCVKFVDKINKKSLLSENAHFLMQAIIHLYELKGLYNKSLECCILLFLKCPAYPQIILKLFSFSLLCLKDEVYLILLANYPQKIAWLKHFLFFILYSVNYQLRNKKLFDNFLFLIENVTKRKKEKTRSSSFTHKKPPHRDKGTTMRCNALVRETKRVQRKSGAKKNGEKNASKLHNIEIGRSQDGDSVKQMGSCAYCQGSGKNGLYSMIDNINSVGHVEYVGQVEPNEQYKGEGGNYAGRATVPNCAYDNLLRKNEKNCAVIIYKKIVLYNSLYSRVTLYDTYMYISNNKFSNYFPKFFLFSKMFIMVNIKRSFYERNYMMCYSLSKLLLMNHMYESSIITFFVNSAYLLNKISCIKKLAQELKKNKKHIFFLFCNAALLLYFKQIERSIQIYKYIVDTYQNVFSDLYFYSLFNLIYTLQLTQKAHQIVIFCKNLNKLFFNNIHTYILLSYYYFVNDLPSKSYCSLAKAYDIYRFHPDIYYILSLLSLRDKKYKECVAFSELALFFSLKKEIIRNYIFTKIYENQYKYVPSHLILYNFKKVNTYQVTYSTYASWNNFLCYLYFELLTKSYIIFYACSEKRYVKKKSKRMLLILQKKIILIFPFLG
ncbi:conserved Plasmodium protein, unknown function [Plasmodium ovale]|uniref:Uncharacterized protein n=1 Tax=Plasmodium ovale TaxID=36330 RepID=A0A1D3UA14_PLAOA|nr:conserved Plasmodium protein, unknown function [Plasmodium ovale]